MKEWTNPWNPFNSSKVLLWKKHLEACAKEDYLIPITVDIDPSNRCNYRCQHCNAYDIITNSHQDMPADHMLKLADFLKEWGSDTPEGNPKSACVAGGGEPLMNPGTMPFLERMYENGLETGLITNGSLLDDKKISLIAKVCRWVGFSMDASTPQTYNKIKFGIDTMKESLFQKVCENIEKLCTEVRKIGSNNDIAFKFLLCPDNANEIYSSALLAKNLGIKDFHLRPVGYLNLTKTKDKNLIYTPELLESINKQIEEAMKLEDGYFRFFGVRHKFNPDFSVKKNFSRCWAIPMLPTFSADGNVQMCFDMRGRQDLFLCRHHPDLTEIARFWNSEKHKEMVRNININDCPRCTFGAYNEIVEQVIIKDGMCRNFP